MVDLPRGTVTYLFADVQGSTKLWEDSPELMMTVVGLHNGVIDRVVDANCGFSVKPREEGTTSLRVWFWEAIRNLGSRTGSLSVEASPKTK